LPGEADGERLPRGGSVGDAYRRRAVVIVKNADVVNLID
jgi:hypothetical protein